MKKILLIDSYSIANRSYYAIKNDMTSPNGIPTKVVYGYLLTMIRYIKEVGIDFVVAAFDCRGKNFRHELYELYKGQRQKMDETIHDQIDIIKDILKLMNIQTIEKVGYEADDIIGTLAKKLCKDNEVYILSGDRDLFQLVGTNCKQIYPSSDTKNNSIYDSNRVFEKMGVWPDQITSYKALAGDSSDNIPGVRGIGDKTAIKLIQDGGYINNIIENIDNMDVTPRIKTLLHDSKDQALLSYKLAIICTDVGGIDYEERKYLDGIDNNKIFEKLSYYGLNTVINLLNIDEEHDNYYKVKDINVDFIRFKSIVDSFDVPYDDVSFTVYADTLFMCKKGINEIYILNENINDAIEYLSEGAVRLLSYDLKSFLPVLKLKRDGRDFFDIKIAAYTLDSSQSMDPEDIYVRYVGCQKLFKSNFDGLVGSNGKKIKKESQNELRNREILKNGAFLAANVSDIIEKKIIEEDVYKLFYEIEMPLVFVLNDMYQSGISVDRDMFIEYSKELDKKIEDISKEIYKLAGEEFNINSPKVLGGILFDKLNIKSGKKTKSGWSTSIDVLEKIKNDNEIIPLILEYRKLYKLNSTYVNGFLRYIAEDGRIHTKFRQTVATTGRLSSTDPNLQNLPIKSDSGKALRKAFIPKEGYTFVDADYSQVELRILAHLSKDEIMINDFNNGEDIHTQTASRIFKVKPSEVTDQQRRNAKAVNFGLIYGKGGYSLSQDLGISVKEANEYIESYFGHYPKIKDYLDSEIDFAKKNGYVKTIFNRRRYIPSINNKNSFVAQEAQRIAMNSPIQGSAADIIKLSMNNLFHKINHDKLDAKIILQIHDELMLEVRDKDVEKLKKILKEVMETAVDLAVTLKVDVSSGKNIYELK